MQIVCDGSQFDKLPGAVVNFFATCWEPPLSEDDGHRTHIGDLNQQTMAALNDFVDYMEKAMRDKKRAGFMVRTGPDGAGHNVISQLWTWRDKEDHIAETLMNLWNERKDLGRCIWCGRVFVPPPGKRAKFCNGSCRVAKHRADKRGS